jgi:tRNA (mo5U34)-methyltransferase
MRFHPWRKGPLWFFDHKIDTEWRSDWKWNRVCDAVSLQGCRVLDVGCGNGYFGWRMIEAGAEWVLGFDPILRFLMQFEVFNRYAAGPARHFVVPLADSDLPARLNAFDVVFSMGVLYHRTSPIDHLRSLADALVPGGTLILETLIIEGEGHRVLVPEDRYAQMRNVWFLPTVEMLRLWLRRTGFEAVELVDVSATTTAEQRSTDWMTFQSLADFLSPDDASKTIEGYSAPIRATLKAIRPR